MQTKIEDFNTGWYGISIGLKDVQIDKMIQALQKLKLSKDHFHARSDYQGSAGIGDIEFYWMDDDSKENMKIDDSFLIEPNR